MIVIEVVEAMAFFGFGYLVGALLNRKPPVIKQVIDPEFLEELVDELDIHSVTEHADRCGMVLMPKGFEDIRRGKSKRLP
jgi:hypothetical protein